MRLLALDPGLKGGYAVFYDDVLTTSGRMPMAKVTITYGITRSLVDVAKLASWVRAYDVDTVVTEYQTAMPGQSSVATGTTFLNWGLLLALPMLCGIAGKVVHPRVWKRHFDVGRHKAAAIYHARLLFPGLGTNVRDGEAEAILIGRYWLEAGREKERLQAAKPLPQRRRKPKPRPAGHPSASSRRRGSGASSGRAPA